MLDERDLQAIAQLIDQRLAAQEERLEQRLTAQEERLEQRLTAQEERFDQKLTAQKDDILQEATRQMRILLDLEIKPQFNLLAEGQQMLLETLAPKSRVEALEDEVAFMKQIIKTLAHDVNELKKAN